MIVSLFSWGGFGFGLVMAVVCCGCARFVLRFGYLLPVNVFVGFGGWVVLWMGLGLVVGCSCLVCLVGFEFALGCFS